MYHINANLLILQRRLFSKPSNMPPQAICWRRLHHTSFRHIIRFLFRGRREKALVLGRPWNNRLFRERRDEQALSRVWVSNDETMYQMQYKLRSCHASLPQPSGKMSKKCAIIFGANGISGIAMTKTLLASDEWGPIVCVSRRPPQLETNDSRIQFVSIDMVTSSAEDLASKLSATGAATAQYAFFYTYIEKQDPQEIADVNKMLLEKALQATSLVAPKLKSFMLQTGTKVRATLCTLNSLTLSQMNYNNPFFFPSTMVTILEVTNWLRIIPGKKMLLDSPNIFTIFKKTYSKRTQTVRTGDGSSLDQASSLESQRVCMWKKPNVCAN
jgi:hypothetical protein